LVRIVVEIEYIEVNPTTGWYALLMVSPNGCSCVRFRKKSSSCLTLILGSNWSRTRCTVAGEVASPNVRIGVWFSSTSTTNTAMIVCFSFTKITMSVCRAQVLFGKIFTSIPAITPAWCVETSFSWIDSWSCCRLYSWVGSGSACVKSKTQIALQ